MDTSDMKQRQEDMFSRFQESKQRFEELARKSEAIPPVQKEQSSGVKEIKQIFEGRPPVQKDSSCHSSLPTQQHSVREQSSGVKEITQIFEGRPPVQKDQTLRFQEIRQMLDEQSSSVKEITQRFEELTRKSEGRPPVQKGSPLKQKESSVSSAISTDSHGHNHLPSHQHPPRERTQKFEASQPEQNGSPLKQKESSVSSAISTDSRGHNHLPSHQHPPGERTQKFEASQPEQNEQTWWFKDITQMFKEIKQSFAELARKSEGSPTNQKESSVSSAISTDSRGHNHLPSHQHPPRERIQRFEDQLQRAHEKLKEDYDQLQRVHEKSKEDKEKLKEDYEKLKKEMDERWAQFQNDWQETFLYPDWRKKFFKAANVILDPLTAHRNLSLSEEGRCVTWEEKQHDLPDDPQRFHSPPCVLGQLSITKGKYYWEVEIGNYGFWDLGICRDSVTRKGRVVIKPDDGFWVIRFYNDEYWALTSPETKLNPKKQPTRVCIFLEYEDKRLSFYNMTDNSHIYTFSQCSFHGSLRPIFRLWPGDSRLLTIYPGH